jgi:hypothetical protein
VPDYGNHPAWAGTSPAGKVAVQRVQGGPLLSRRCDGLSSTGLTPKMMHDRVDASDADLSIFGFAIP